MAMSLQESEQDICIYKAEFLVPKRLRHRPHDCEPQLLIKREGDGVRAHHKIELHRHIACGGSLGQTMFDEGPADALTLRRRNYQIRCARDVRPAVRVIRTERVHSPD